MKLDSDAIGEREVQAGNAERCPEDDCNEALHSDFHREVHLVNNHERF